MRIAPAAGGHAQGPGSVSAQSMCTVQLAAPTPATDARPGYLHLVPYDVFISHASEDKAGFVEPLVVALRDRGVTVWYDRFELKLGDDLRQRIDEGLRDARYGVVVLSPAFLGKRWPELELSALFALEGDGRKRILPIRYQLTHQELCNRAPLLGARLTIGEEAGRAAVVRAVLDVLSADGHLELPAVDPPTRHAFERWVWASLFLGVGLVALFLVTKESPAPPLVPAAVLPPGEPVQGVAAPEEEPPAPVAPVVKPVRPARPKRVVEPAPALDDRACAAHEKRARTLAERDARCTPEVTPGPTLQACLNHYLGLLTKADEEIHELDRSGVVCDASGEQPGNGR